ncbi:MAG: ribbon-helix-helix domain-containing protein [Bacteroidetes bacterium]|nr:ribbon-helix-helix domain-containing protein [Bacteroidota bacterium]
MATFTSSLPDDLLNELNDKAKSLSLPKNKLIEKALRLFLNQITRAEYIKSYQQMADDYDVLSVAEEGMAEYLNDLED